MPAQLDSVITACTPCGADVIRLAFTRPEGYVFSAGQWLRLTLTTDGGSETKTFSLSSAPGDPELEMATRLSGSAFKQALARLRPGDPVGVSPPGGRLSLPGNATRAAFLTGGVGVTPVRSMLRDAMQRGARFDDVVMLYGNRDPECALYLDEFEAMARIGVRVVPIYEHPAAGWTGEAGYITASLVTRHVDLADGRPVYVTGPPPMVAAMDAVLDELGIELASRRIERFGPSRESL